MKVTEHVEHLLRQGRKPKELIELGFPKSVVTKVRRQLRVEKAAPQSRTQKGRTEVGSRPRSAVTPLVEATPDQPRPGSLESKVQQLESQLDVLEAIIAELGDIETRLDGTPTLGLKHHFKCDCGASGFVAVHIKCTKCGRDTYWGWWPKKE